jgi:hypothetical protein
MKYIIFMINELRRIFIKLTCSMSYAMEDAPYGIRDRLVRSSILNRLSRYPETFT